MVLHLDERLIGSIIRYAVHVTQIYVWLHDTSVATQVHTGLLLPCCVVNFFGFFLSFLVNCRKLVAAKPYTATCMLLQMATINAVDIDAKRVSYYVAVILQCWHKSSLACNHHQTLRTVLQLTAYMALAQHHCKHVEIIHVDIC